MENGFNFYLLILDVLCFIIYSVPISIKHVLNYRDVLFERDIIHIQEDVLEIRHEINSMPN